MGDQQEVTADSLTMQAAIAQLAGFVTGLHSELHRLTAQVETRPEQTAPPVPLAAQGQETQAANREVTGKLKLPLPKSFSGSSQPGAVENFLFDCEQYFIGMDVAANKQVLFAAGLLEGGAKSWWRYMCQRLEGTEDLAELYTWLC
jgi:hypothetical protein